MMHGVLRTKSSANADLEDVGGVQMEMKSLIDNIQTKIK